MYTNDDDDESWHFRPDAWKVAWEATQDVIAPSCEVKAAAERLVWAEFLQQAMGWLLLTQIGVLLGSFGQVMSQAVCLLSWCVFMLEAMLKFGRSWVHTHFFMDVPCAYVPLHQEAAHDSLALFGSYLMSATVLEVVSYVPYILAVFKFWHDKRNCYDESNLCPDGTTLLIELLFVSSATAVLHWVSSFVTVCTFHAAMGVGLVALIRKKKPSFKDKSSWHENSSECCHCNKRGCKAGKLFRSPRTDSDRVLCLTWWVHMARHRHLSAVVASAQPGNCGLPGHWFDSVGQLKRIVAESVVSGAGDVALNNSGPLWVSQEMALRALVSLAKQGRVEICREILAKNGFDLLVQVVREGKLANWRGLAAAAIAVLATQHEAITKECVDLSLAVNPLKRLARCTELELKEVALGALLNTALNEEKSAEVLSKLQSPDGIVVGDGGTPCPFIAILMECAHLGPSTRCQELATGLMARLAGDSKQVRTALLMDISRSGVNGVELFTSLLQHGLTTEVKASAAGVLAELAYKEGKTIGIGRHGESCIVALIEGLRSEPRIAYASARALCNLAIKGEENKLRIVSGGGIGALVDLLKGNDHLSPNEESMNQRDAISYRSSLYQMQEQVQAEAARALWMLAYNDRGNQDLIADAHAIPLLADLLFKSRAKIHIQAVAALSSIAWKNERNQELIGQGGTRSRILQRIVRLLVNIDDEKMEEKVVEKVALAITSFAEGSKANQDSLVKLGAGLELGKIIHEKGRSFKKDKALSRARKALQTLNREQP